MKTMFGFDKSFEEADIVLFGAPFDSTTSFRPGTRFAPDAMRGESFGLESYSPYLDRDLLESAICDGGDLELCIGDSRIALKTIEQYTGRVVSAGKLPVMIGGEHLVTLGAIRAIAARHPDLHVLHFDAHTDLRDDYLGAQLSHATVMRRVWDILGDGRIHQFGIRSGDRSEFLWAPDHVRMHRFDLSGLDGALLELSQKPVYLSLDLDVLDPSVFPGTGTPEAGGVSFKELLEAVYACCKLDIVGCDLCELCPVYDQSGASTAVALKLLRELLLSLK